MKRQADGEFEDLVITAPTGETLCIKVLTTSPQRVRFGIEGDRAMRVHRSSQHAPSVDADGEISGKEG